MPAIKNPPKTPQMPAIAQALDQMSWQWLGDNCPELADAVAAETTRGADPDSIRRYVMAQTQRLELALRCQQASRYLQHSD